MKSQEKKKKQEQEKIALPEGKPIPCSGFLKKVPGASWDTCLYLCHLFIPQIVGNHFQYVSHAGGPVVRLSEGMYEAGVHIYQEM